MAYFSESVGQVVVEHLASIEVVQVNSESLYCALEDCFKKHEVQVPWSNVMNLLMDSCNSMRSSKNKVKMYIKKTLAPQLVDIGRYICHHIHNASKMFIKPFDQHFERLYTYIMITNIQQ